MAIGGWRRAGLANALGVVFALSISEAHAVDGPLVITTYATSQPLTVLTNALQAANSGITILSSSFIGIDGQSGTYTGFNLPSSTAGLPTITVPNGVLLTNGSAAVPLTNTSTYFSHTTNTGSNALLTTLVGAPTYDQNVISLTFTVNNTTKNGVSAQFVFGTDEYPEYISSYNDSFGFFVDGTNYAKFANGNLVSINPSTVSNFNDNSEQDSNGATAYGLEYDGLSNGLTINAPLDATLATHTLTIAIADVNDSAVDSGVFIGALQAIATSGGGGIVTTPPTIDTTNGDIAPNIFSLGSTAAMANTVEFDGGTLRMTGGDFPGNIITAPVTIDPTNGTVDTSTGDGGFSGIVSGPGSLTVIGSHTFSLTGANSYAGGTNLNGGTLVVGNDSALGTGPLAMADGTALKETVGVTLANAIALTGLDTIETSDTTADGDGLIASGVISGSGTLVKTGATGLRLTGANTYSGGTILAAGHIGLGNNDALGTGTLTFAGGFLRAHVDGLTISNDAVLQSDGRIDTRAYNLTYAGVVSGGGQLTKTGSGTLALTNYNTYGGGTVIDGGTVQVSTTYFDDATKATIQYYRQHPSQQAGLADTVGLVNNGGAIATSVGYGPVTLDGGTLQFTGGSYEFANAIRIGPDGGTIDSAGKSEFVLDGGFSDASAGPGPLVFTNTGTRNSYDLYLFRTSSFTGGSEVTGNTTVLLGSDNALGTGALQVDAGGVMDIGAFNQSVTSLTGQGSVVASGYANEGITSTLTVQSGAFSGVLNDGSSYDSFYDLTSTGFLALTKVSDGTTTGGTLTLSGTSLYSGPTTVAGGTLQAGSTTALSPNSAVSIAGGATLDLNAFSNTVGSLAGAGTVTNTGATAATLTSGGNNGSTGFSGTVTDGAAPLALIKTGSGTLELSGANTYSGGTTVAAGIIAVGSSTALGTGPVRLDDLTELQFVADGLTIGNAIELSGQLDPVIDTGSNAETISGPITGPGALTKLGSGTLDLTGANTYSGATEVAAGTLLVDGSILNSTITVDNGATLGGTGTIRDFVMDSGATLAPGTAVALKATGNATFLTGSIYQVTVNPDGSGSRLTVGGSASLGGATLAVLAGNGTFSARTYTLLTAVGGLSGTFGTVTTPSALTLFNPTVSYTANDVTLTLSPADFATFAKTPNQAATAAAIQALGPNSPLYNAVLAQNAAGAVQAFNAASGVSHASTTGIVATNTRVTTGLIVDRLWDVSGSGLSAQQVLDQFAPDRLPALVRCYGPTPDPAPVAPPRSFTAWGEGFGTFGHTDASANAGALNRSLGGFVLGIDTPLGDVWRGGIAGGYTNTSFQSPLDGGSGTVQGVFGSLYGGARYGAIDIRVGTTVGGTFVDSRRDVAFGGFFEKERSSNDGYTVQAFGEVGYRIPAQGFIFEPIAGAAFLHSHQNAFSEQGGAAALTVGALDNDLGTTTAGFRTEMQPFKEVPLVAHGMLAWQHVIGNVSPATTLAFSANPSNTFSVTGTPIDRDALSAELALDYRVSRALDIGVSYAGLIGPTASDHSVKGRAEYKF